MSRRLLFVAGHLSGVVVGAVAVLLFVAGRPKTSAPSRVTPVVHPVEASLLPDGWQRREFNGQPYYVVPLGAE